MLFLNPLIQFIEKYPDKHDPYIDDVWYNMWKNPLVINLPFMEWYINKFNVIDWFELSSNIGLTTEFIERYIDEDWCWGEEGLSSNECITPEFIEKH